MRSLKIHPDAEAEIARSCDWHNDQVPRLGDQFLAAIEHALRLIVESPERWASYEEGFRRVLVARFPYSLVYRFNDETIEVIAAAHQRRRPGYWRRRA